MVGVLAVVLFGVVIPENGTSEDELHELGFRWTFFIPSGKGACETWGLRRSTATLGGQVVVTVGTDDGLVGTKGVSISTALPEAQLLRRVSRTAGCHALDTPNRFECVAKKKRLVVDVCKDTLIVGEENATSPEDAKHMCELYRSTGMRKWCPPGAGMVHGLAGSRLPTETSLPPASK